MSAEPVDLEEIEIFWGEMAPCEHLVQMYENDGVFLDTLEGYVAGALRAGEAAVVIATSAHLTALEERLVAQKLPLKAAIAQDQYISLDADEVLSRFMVNGWPDQDRFGEVVTGLLARARKHG